MDEAREEIFSDLEKGVGKVTDELNKAKEFVRTAKRANGPTSLAAMMPPQQAQTRDEVRAIYENLEDSVQSEQERINTAYEKFVNDVKQAKTHLEQNAKIKTKFEKIGAALDKEGANYAVNTANSVKNAKDVVSEGLRDILEKPENQQNTHA